MKTRIISETFAYLALTVLLAQCNTARTRVSPLDEKSVAPSAAAVPSIAVPTERQRKTSLVSVNDTGQVWAPRTCPPPSQPVDVVFHFHGVPTVVAENAERAGLSVAVVVTNEGDMADSYAKAWSAPNSFERLLARAEEGIVDHCQSERELGRIALSSFSAGFSAVQRLLAEHSVPERVDAVLLEDSLYASYLDPKTKQLSRVGLQPFVDFARRAVRGDKLMAVTHSSISTVGYASTVETADYLLVELGVDREPASSGEGTRAEAGAFWLRGLPGVDAEAHGGHLREMGDTVFARLAERW